MSRAKITILVGIAASFTLLACWLLFFHGRGIHLNSDEARWDELARSVAAGTGLLPPNQPYVVDREPFYAIFAGIVYRLFGAHVAYILFIQSALLVGALMLLAWMLIPVLSWPVAVLVPLATILAPGVTILAVGNLLAETIALVLLVTINAVFISGLRKRNHPWLFFSGTLLGLLALTRYIFYPLALFLAVGIVILKERLGVDQTWQILFWLLAGFFVPVIVWTVYISNVLGAFTPIGTKGGGEVLLNVQRMDLAGSNLLEYAVGALLGDAAGRYLFPNYAKDIEPYSYVNSRELAEYAKRYLAEGQAASANASALREGALLIVSHPFRYGFVALGQFFIKNSPMLWHNAADTRHLFAGTHPELPEWFRATSVALFRLTWIGMALFALGTALWILLRSSIPLYLFLPAVAILSENVLHVFFDSVGRHAVPLYPFYFLFCVFGIRQLWQRRTRAALPARTVAP